MIYVKKLILFLGIAIHQLSAHTSFYLNTLNNNSPKTIEVWKMDTHNRKNPHPQLIASIEPGQQLTEPLMIETEKNGAEIYNHPGASHNRFSNLLIQTADENQKFYLLVHRKIRRASPSKTPRPQLIEVDINLFEDAFGYRQYDATYEKVFSENGSEIFYIGLTFVSDQQGMITPETTLLNVDMRQE